MNKADLVDKIAGSAHISKTQAAGAIDSLVEAITGALKKNERVTLSGFGTFSVSQRKARNGRICWARVSRTPISWNRSSRSLGAVSPVSASSSV